MSTDLDRATLRVLLADARAQGLTNEAYELRYGVSLGPSYPAERRWSAEVPMSELSEGSRRRHENAAPVAEGGGSVSRVG